MAIDWSVVVCNGRLQPSQQPLSASEFLRSHPPGAYTTTRTMDQASCLLFWERHMARLFESMKLVAEAMPGLYPQEIRHSSFNWAKDAKHEIHSSLQVGLTRALEAKKADDELVISFLVNGKRQSKCDFFVHLSHMAITPKASWAHLAIMGPGRNLPLAKLSSWAKTRQILEQSRPGDTTEVLLSRDGSSLLEGLLTNFFVVINITPTSEENQQHSDGHLWQDFEVQTASLEQGVLPGVIRKLVIEILSERNIRFREVAPVWEERDTWKEAFITSSVRLVQPVASIQAPSPWNADCNPEKWLGCDWERFKFEALNEITETIKDEVIRRSREEGVPLETILK